MQGSESTGHGREHPDDEVAGPRLATDRHRFSAREHTAQHVTTTLGKETGTRLAEVSAAAGVPATVTVLAAWAAVLHRHTGQREQLIGLDTASFTDAPAPPTVPLPVRLRTDAPFAEELTRLHDAVTDTLSGGDAVAAPADPRAVAGRSPAPSLRHGTWDVALTLDPGRGRTGLTLHYNASLFTRATALWILGHCARLLAEAVAAPGTPLRDLPVQDEPENVPWHLPVPDGYGAPAAVRPGESLVDRFRDTAATHPDRLAVTGSRGGLTYADLDRVSDTVARRLRRSAGPGTRVALLCGHDVDAVAAIWSVLKTGAAYVPLDPRQPDSRLTRLLTDADVGAIVCDPALTARAGVLSRGGRVVPIDALDVLKTLDASGPAEQPPSAERAPGDADALAYLLHTSGSTGRPKAVAQSHANVLAHTLTYARRLRVGPGDRIPLLARYTFDAAVMDLYAALLTGASLHVVDPVATAPELRERLGHASVTVLHGTPTLFRHLVGDLPEDTGPDPAFASVRAVVLGGEEAGQHDLRRFLAAFPRDSSLVNGLGPTECTLVAQYLASPADLAGTALPVGHPVEGVSLRLLDEDGRPTELLGELEVRGDCVAHGYWKEPAATDAAFGTGPDGTRHYRTGDLVRRRADGALVFAGRKDRQIKLRGHRIEPGEIEAALRSHPTVAEAVVTVDTRAASPRLVGYVTPATGFPPDTAELLAYLARTLPDYAVPWQVLALDRLPLGPTGKVDRSRLPVPEEVSAVIPAAPTTPLEQAVAAIWCRVLGTASADLHGNFMAAGGDSVRMLTLLTDVKDELGAEAPLMEFLAAPTIATLVKLIERET